MVNQNALMAMSAELYTYDVEQHGWEHDGYGLEVNAGHVLTHLNKGLQVKDFANPSKVEAELAPDSVQYALRFARWGQFSLASLTDGQLGYVDEMPELAPLWTHSTLPPGLARYLSATTLLNGFVHDLGHRKTREQTSANAGETALRVARHLLLSADEQATAFGFALGTSFYDRLTGLREHFGIPEPRDI